MKTITFFSMMEGVADTYPIIEAAKAKPNWIESIRQHYKNQKFSDNEKTNHIYRCPGINDLVSTGFILTAPWDISIEPAPDGVDFRWGVPIANPEKYFPGSIITGHAPRNGLENLPARPGSVRTIVHLSTPWHIIVPDDLKFIMIPLPYPDSFEFEAQSGILDPSISSELNCQIRWLDNKTAGVIKAGTPLCQLIPLSEDKFKLVVRDKTENDEKWVSVRTYLNHCTFAPRRNIIKNAYKKFFKSKFKFW
jgi:hypothetical protein